MIQDTSVIKYKVLAPYDVRSKERMKTKGR